MSQANLHTNSHNTCLSKINEQKKRKKNEMITLSNSASLTRTIKSTIAKLLTIKERIENRLRGEF